MRVIELLARKMGCLCRLDMAKGRRWAGVLNGGLGDGLWVSDNLFFIYNRFAREPCGRGLGRKTLQQHFFLPKLPPLAKRL